MNGETRSLDTFDTPFAKKIELQEVQVEEGISLIRIRIREGSRFTIVDLDPVTAKRWGETMVNWAEQNNK